MGPALDFFVLSFLYVLAFAQTCYFPNGSPALADAPCASVNSDQGVACCNKADICLDNHLCYDQSGDGLVSRGSCTDQQWKSSGCPQTCADSEISRCPSRRLSPVTSCSARPIANTSLFLVTTDNGQPLIPISYQTTNAAMNSYCCGFGYDPASNQCMNSTQGSFAPVNVTTGKVIYNRTSGSISPNITDSVVSAVTITATSTALATGTIFATVATHTALPSGALSSGGAAALGAGLGIPLGLALLGALGMLWREKRNSKDLKRHVDACRRAETAAISAPRLLSHDRSNLVTIYKERQPRDATMHYGDGSKEPGPQQLETFHSYEMDGRGGR